MLYLVKKTQGIRENVAVSKLLLLTVLSSLFNACGQVEEGEIEYNIDCIDGCSPEVQKPQTQNPIVVQGPPGRDGESVVGPQGIPGESIKGDPGETIVGPKGSDGVGCTVLDTPQGATITCGSTSTVIFDGEAGSDGIDGESCTVAATTNGAEITCGQNTVTLENGEDGENGQDSNSFVFFDPCGNGPGPDEIIFVFSDGSWVAWYKNLGLTVLNPGTTYETSDAQKCIFTVPG